MADLKISEIMDMHNELHEKNKGFWKPLTPENGRDSLLWMFEELGEAAAVIKKRGDQAIMDDPHVREAFVEEFADAMMYFAKALMSYSITPEEFSESYIRKHERNLTRDFAAEYGKFLSKK